MVDKERIQRLERTDAFFTNLLAGISSGHNTHTTQDEEASDFEEETEVEQPLGDHNSSATLDNKQRAKVVTHPGVKLKRKKPKKKKQIDREKIVALIKKNKEVKGNLHKGQINGILEEEDTDTSVADNIINDSILEKGAATEPAATFVQLKGKSNHDPSTLENVSKSTKKKLQTSMTELEVDFMRNSFPKERTSKDKKQTPKKIIVPPHEDNLSSDEMLTTLLKPNPSTEKGSKVKSVLREKVNSTKKGKSVTEQVVRNIKQTMSSKGKKGNDMKSDEMEIDHTDDPIKKTKSLVPSVLGEEPTVGSKNGLKMKSDKKKAKRTESVETETESSNDEDMVFGDFDFDGIDSDADEEEVQKMNDRKGNISPQKSSSINTGKKEKNVSIDELRERVRQQIIELKLKRNAREDDATSISKKKSKIEKKRILKGKRKESFQVRKKLKREEQLKNVAKQHGEKDNSDEEELYDQVQFNKFDFEDSEQAAGKKRNPRRTKIMVEKQTGKNYKMLIEKAEKKQEKYTYLKERDPDMAETWMSTEKWRKAEMKAEGAKIKDDPELLKKSLKRQEQRKKRSKKKMQKIEDDVVKDKHAKQMKRYRNLQEKKKERKAKKVKRLQKKGKLLLPEKDRD